MRGFFPENCLSIHGFMDGPVSGLFINELVVDEKINTLEISSLDLALLEGD